MDEEDFWPQDEIDGQPTGDVHIARAGLPIAVPAQPGIPVPNRPDLTPFEPHGGLPHPTAPIPVDPHSPPISIPPQIAARLDGAADQQGSPQAPGDTASRPDWRAFGAHSAWSRPPVAEARTTPADSTTLPSLRGPSAPAVGVPHHVPAAPLPRGRVEAVPAHHDDPEVTPGVTALPQPPPQQPAPGVYPVQPPDGGGRMPTAEEFARRRSARQPEQIARMGIQATLRKSTFGLVNLGPGRREQELLRDVELVRRNFGGLRQITVVNPKGGAGKTVAVLLLAMTLGQRRGGYVLAWDNNETQGTLGMRAQQDFHTRTVRDLLRDLRFFQGARGRVGDLSQYVRAQGEGMFEVLASDESATAGEMLTDLAFGEIRDVVSRFYKVIVVDTGNNVRAPNWQAAVDATDQLVVTLSARNDSAETAARMLDHLEQTGRTRLVRQAVTVLSLPQNQRELDVAAIERHFTARTRAVVPVPYERVIDTGEPIPYGQLTETTREAWLKVAAAVAEGL